jgi:hypothetical protein
MLQPTLLLLSVKLRIKSPLLSALPLDFFSTTTSTSLHGPLEVSEQTPLH